MSTCTVKILDPAPNVAATGEEPSVTRQGVHSVITYSGLLTVDGRLLQHPAELLSSWVKVAKDLSHAAGLFEAQSRLALTSEEEGADLKIRACKNRGRALAYSHGVDLIKQLQQGDFSSSAIVETLKKFRKDVHTGMVRRNVSGDQLARALGAIDALDVMIDSWERASAAEWISW